MAVGDVYQFTIVSSLGGKVFNNVLHFREITADDTGFAAATLNFGFMGEIMSNYLDLCSDDMTVVGLYTRRVFPAPGVPFAFVPSSNNQGAESSPAGSTTAAAILTLYTDLHTKSGRGRVYIPAIPESLTENGLLNIPGFAALDALGIKLQTSFNGATSSGSPTVSAYQGTVWSRKLNADNLITHTFAHSNLATIRRRRMNPGIPPAQV